MQIWLKDLRFPVLWGKQVFKNKNNDTLCYRFLVNNGSTTTDKKTVGVAAYHKSLKQNTRLAKSPAHTIKTQSNHLFCSIWAYVKHKFQTKLNHFQTKAKIYLKALKVVFEELNSIKQKALSA